MNNNKRDPYTTDTWESPDRDISFSFRRPTCICSIFLCMRFTQRSLISK